MRLYHGSHIAGIRCLLPNSPLHGTKDQMVTYLTANLPYALFYIWDAQHNHTNYKYVTCGIKNGVVIYEEQFPNQLSRFYQGVRGYLYCMDNSATVYPVEHREDMYYSSNPVSVLETLEIEDVYEEILSYERKGLIKIIRYENMPKEKLNMLHKHILEHIKKEDPCAQIYKNYFPELWAGMQ